MHKRHDSFILMPDINSAQSVLTTPDFHRLFAIDKLPG